MNLEQRIQDLIDERLFAAFWAAVEHFKSTDLVLYFDASESVDPVSIYMREKLLEGDDVPEEFRNKLHKPAKETAKILKESATAFWLVASFPDGEMGYAAVIAEPMGKASVA